MILAPLDLAIQPGFPRRLFSVLLQIFRDYTLLRTSSVSGTPRICDRSMVINNSSLLKLLRVDSQPTWPYINVDLLHDTDFLVR